MTKSILLVDDAAFMRLNFKNIVKGMGCKVVGEASNGVEALRKYRDINPDIVLMDIAMPELDGIEAVKEIIDYNYKATVIMVSTNGQKKMILKAIDKGAKVI